MSASFIQEMTAVQEAFDTWKMSKKADDLNNTSLPTEKIVETKTLEEHKRLMGEIGYYRTWSITGKKPTTDVKSDDDSFKSAGSSEIVFYPAGVQDLYYLDNEVLGLEKNNKKYLIDARNSMIYSLTGGSINGIRVHSLAMLRMIQNGISDAPRFAEAEASNGSGVFAGSKWLTDKDGNYVDENGNIVNEKDRVVNPYGFEIIANTRNNNVYKLYNNGDLYGMGAKGPLLNTPADEMEKINPYKWSKLTIPSQIPGHNNMSEIKVIMGLDTIYVIDSNKDLWAWGNNSYNKLGLNSEQLKEYTEVQPVKLNIGGTYDEDGTVTGSKSVYDVFVTRYQTFVITNEKENYELYASGLNSGGGLGTGERMNSSTSFKKVKFQNPQNIVDVFEDDYNMFDLIIVNGGENLRIFFAGSTKSGNGSRLFKNSQYANGYVTEYVEIADGVFGEKPDIKIVDYSYPGSNTSLIARDDSGQVYWYDLSTFSKIEVGSENGCIEDVLAGYGSIIMKKKINKKVEYWAMSMSASGGNVLGVENEEYYKCFLLDDYFPSDLSASEIKQFNFERYGATYCVTKNGDVYGTGKVDFLGINKTGGTSGEFVKLTMTNGDGFSKNSYFSRSLIVDKDGNYYGTNLNSILYRENILQQNWTLVAENVKKFNASTDSNCVAYIDVNDDLWVAGDNSLVLGLNTEDVQIQTNFVKLKDNLSGTEIYDHINGKIKDYYFGTKKMYIITNKKDNNSLYVSGAYLSQNWATYSYLGCEHDCKIPTLLMENCESVIADRQETLALKKTEKGYELWYWGCCDGNCIPSKSTVPVQWGNNELISNAEKVDLFGIYYDKSYIGYKKNGEYHLMVCGRHNPNSENGGANGIGRTVTNFTEVRFSDNGDIIGFTCGSVGQSFIFTTSNNKYFGFGFKKLLGIGDSSDDVEEDIVEVKFDLNNSKINGIAGGNGWYVVTTSDGRVFGTGTNKYGILGRWKGVGRGESNSRYKTAFNWVECPDLEI